MRALIPSATLGVTLLTSLALLGCREDPGDPDYPDYETTGEQDDGLPQGPDPYEEGEDRLSLGAFYEGDYSDLAEVDDLNVFYYIYDNTYTQSVDEQDVIEGRESAVIEIGSVGWWGGGIHPATTANLSDWTTLFVSFKSADADVAVNLHFQGGGEFIVSAADYGFVPDDTWHNLAIPLSDLTDQGWVSSAAESYFMMIGEGTSGSELKVDNLYYTAD